MDQHETWHGCRPRPCPHCVRWGPSSPSPKGAHPKFAAHDCCGQTAGWIKMPLGTKLGLGPGNSLLDGNPAPPKKGHSRCTDEGENWRTGVHAKFHPIGKGAGYGSPRNCVVSNWGYKRLIEAYPLHDSYEIVRVCGLFHCLISSVFV